MDAAITAQVLQIDAYLTAGTVFCYVSLPHEIDTTPILTDAWARKKRVAVPRCREKGEMDFCLIESLDDLTLGSFGIAEPKDSCPLCVPVRTDVCIVPCLAADLRGCRLGYGGGYYDRYLTAHPVQTVGLCYHGCITETLPTDPFDVPLQILISDKEV